MEKHGSRAITIEQANLLLAVAGLAVALGLGAVIAAAGVGFATGALAGARWGRSEA
jgi:hypothetical protein